MRLENLGVEGSNPGGLHSVLQLPCRVPETAARLELSLWAMPCIAFRRVVQWRPEPPLPPLLDELPELPFAEPHPDIEQAGGEGEEDDLCFADDEWFSQAGDPDESLTDDDFGYETDDDFGTDVD